MPRSATSKKSAGSSKASSKASAPAQRRPYEPHPPPPREPFSLPGTPALPLGPSHPPGYCLVTGLFFNSDAWVPPLRADAAALVARFEKGYPAERDARSESPLEYMKRIWTEDGWQWLHLLGVPQNGPLRAPWGDSIVRAFLEYLNTSEPPLRQAAALLALYLFVGTQAASMPRVFVKVDPDMLEYILALPAQLAPTLDRAASPAAAPGPGPAPADPTRSAPNPSAAPPSADLLCAIHALVTSNLFLVIPPQLFLHPRSLPSVRVIADPERLRRQAQRGLALLGASEEIDALRRGRVRPDAAQGGRCRGKRRREEDDDAAEDGDGADSEGGVDFCDGDGGGDGEVDGVAPVWDARALAALADRSALAKRTADSGDPTGAARASTLVQPEYALQRAVLAEAKVKTRAAMQGVAEHGLIGAELAADEGQDLLALLDGSRASAVGEFAQTLGELVALRERSRRDR
ncbi:hypothetical protein JCM3770_004703 [Rhodotorula araucariae]